MLRPHPYPGLYVVFEGTDGSGKTTQIRLLWNALGEHFPELQPVFVREPGGTQRAEEIRQVLLDPNRRLSDLERARLMAEARKSILVETIIPALARGGLVVADRSFISSEAYQGLGGRLGFLTIRKLNKDLLGESFTYPDCIAFLEVHPRHALPRVRGKILDSFEKRDWEFFEAVHDGYRFSLDSLENEGLGVKIIRISDPEGRLSPHEIHEKVWGEVRPLIEGWLRQREGGISGETQGMSGKERH